MPSPFSRSIQSGFFASTSSDRRVYSADEFSRIFDGLITDGIYAGYRNNFYARSGSGLSVLVLPGRAWLDHVWLYSDETVQVALNAANSQNPRIDTVVLEVNTVDRRGYIKVVEGTPSLNPTRPALSNGSNGIYQHRLADVTVRAEATRVYDYDIYYAVGRSDGIPFVTVIADVNTPVSQLMSKYTAEFDEWFQDLHTNLDQDAAGALQNQINEIEQSITGFALITPGTEVRFPRLSIPTRIANTRNRFNFSIPVGGSISSEVSDVQIIADTMTLYDSGAEELLSWDLSEGVVGGTLVYRFYIEGGNLELVWDYDTELYKFPKGLGWIYLENVRLIFS